MTLAFIRDESENNFIKSHVVNYLRLGAVWNRTKKSFEWEDGTAMNYTNWNSISTCSESNSCCTVEMTSNGKWNIYTCGSQAHALCEHNGATVSNAINSLNDSLIALKEETDLKLINLIVKLDDWTKNITNHVSDIVKDGVKEIIQEEVIKLINDSRNHEIDEKMNNLTTLIDTKLEKVSQERISDEEKMKTEIKKIGESIEALNQSRNQLKNEVINEINQSKNQLKNEVINEMKDELETIRNGSNYLTIDDSRMISMINQLESEKDEISHKLIDNEHSVDSLSKRMFVSLAITILLLIAFIITLGYKYYHDRKPTFHGFKKHPSPTRTSDINSIEDEFV